MGKQKINESQFAKLVHKKMQEHPQYLSGMAVDLNPPKSQKPSGLIAVGGSKANRIMHWAENEVLKDYELIITK